MSSENKTISTIDTSGRRQVNPFDSPRHKVGYTTRFFKIN
jgi:hypothetical protein